MEGFTSSIFVRIAVVVFSVFCLLFIIKTQFQRNDILDRIDDKQAELEKIENIVSELEHQVEEPFDKEYIIKIAKEKLGLRLPPEVVFYNGD